METFQRMVEDPLTLCPECNNHTLKRKIGMGAGIIFKGGGFYETDFKDKKGKRASEPKADSKSDKESGSTSTESKKPASKETPASKESS